MAFALVALVKRHGVRGSAVRGKHGEPSASSPTGVTVPCARSSHLPPTVTLISELLTKSRVL